MFRGPLANFFGVENVPPADRRLAFDIGYDFKMTSIMMVDKIEPLDEFAVKVRDHFMQWDRCRSRIISFGNHVFFEKVKAEDMVEILDEMTEAEGYEFMAKQ